jgi:hypothetical protein
VRYTRAAEVNFIYFIDEKNIPVHHLCLELDFVLNDEPI